MQLLELELQVLELGLQLLKLGLQHHELGLQLLELGLQLLELGPQLHELGFHLIEPPSWLHPFQVTATSTGCLVVDRFVLTDELGRWTKVLDGRSGDLAMLATILCRPHL